MPELLPRTIKAREMKVGDVVSKAKRTGPWDCAVVKRIDRVQHTPLATLFRPYGTCFDTEYSGPSVICLIGLEEYPQPLNDELYVLWDRKNLS